MTGDTFAAAFLEQWAKIGGTAYIAREQLWLGYGPENHEAARPLFNLFKSIFGAREAVQAHMVSHGLTTYFHVEKERLHAC